MIRERSREDLSVRPYRAAQNRIHSLRERYIWKLYFQSSQQYFVDSDHEKNSLGSDLIIFLVPVITPPQQQQDDIITSSSHKQEADYGKKLLQKTKSEDVERAYSLFGAINPIQGYRICKYCDRRLQHTRTCLSQPSVRDTFQLPLLLLLFFEENTCV